MIAKAAQTFATVLCLFAALTVSALGGDVPDQAALNDQVRAQLLELGDDGTTPRETVHYAYPKGSGVRPAAQLAEVARGMGFDVFAAQTDGGLVLVEVAPVAGEAFDQRTEALAVLFDAAGWDYDGWECALVTQ